jgi:hypothetical protein
MTGDRNRDIIIGISKFVFKSYVLKTEELDYHSHPQLEIFFLSKASSLTLAPMEPPTELVQRGSFCETSG